MLPYEHTGNKNANTIVICLHGFPDSVRLWDATLAGISDAQFLTISYPNYHPGMQNKWGIDFAEIVTRIKITIDSVVDGRTLNKILLTHDWGAMLGYLFDQKYPQFVDEIIALDVGAQSDPKGKQALMIVTYQWTFALCFLLTLIPILGERVGTLIASLYMKFILGFPAPPGYSARMNYFYFNFWKNFILSKVKLSTRLLRGYSPSVPVVYIYGEDKPFQFHSARWHLTLSKNKDSEFIGLKCGHWIMKQQGEFLINKLRSRLLRYK